VRLHEGSVDVRYFRSTSRESVDRRRCRSSTWRDGAAHSYIHTVIVLPRWHYCNIFIIIIFKISLTSTKPQSLNSALSRIWLQKRLIGVKGVEEGDCISPLEGYWQLLKQKGGFSRFASDYCGLSADFLDRLNSPVIPGTSGFYGNWVEDVSTGQFFVLGNFVGVLLSLLLLLSSLLLLLLLRNM